MALIACSECGRQISDRATACPSCGSPVPTQELASAPAVHANPVEVTKAPVITTEATGKPYKAVQVVGGVIMCLAMVSCAAGASPGTGGLFFIVGAIVYLVAGAMAWWAHG
jgi:hypothetical protein